MQPIVAILGASGAVGQEMLKVLEENQFPASEVRLLASERSAGRRLPFRGRLLEVQAVTPESFDGVHVALFSAGAGVSQKWAPIAAGKGAIIVDNTSAFRMDADVPLVVPECNLHTLSTIPARRIIANPNCSTIQMVQVLKPLHERLGIERLVIATYQSVSGKGAEAIAELKAQSRAILDGRGDFPMEEFPHQIAFNVLPHIDVFLENGYTKEEMKMVQETRKILEAASMRVTATCVRVPVLRGHSEAVNVEFAKAAPVALVRELVAAVPNVVVVDDPARNDYPLPIYCEGRNETYVGRLRQDISVPGDKAVDMWIVSDNLRKGAAWNAVQIARWLVDEGKVG
jgi:aspartate-semialdehyde dehydrogenase